MITFTDPKQLPCLHSFCLHCLEGILRTSGRHDIITCPECRRESRVPSSGNLKDLPTNFRINSLLDVLAIKQCSTTGVICGNCDNRSAQSCYCFQCCVFWCEDCITAHNIIRANREHRVLALTDFKDEDFVNVLRRPAFCQRKHHEKNELKLFCKICETPICNTCALTDHEGHAKTLLEEAANEHKLQVKSVIESQRKHVQQQKNKIFNIDQICVQIQEQAAAVKEDAQMFAEAMILVIEAKKQEICNEVENEATMSIKRLVTQKRETEHQVKMAESIIEQTETLLERSTSAEIVQLDTSLDAVFQKGVVTNEVEKVNCGLEAARRFVFAENETLMNKTITEGIGSFNAVFNKTSARQSIVEGRGTSEAVVGLEAQFVLTTQDTEGKKCYDEGDRISLEIRNDQGQDCTTKARIQDNKDGSYKISYFAKNTGERHVSVKVNGQQVHGSPFVVSVKRRQYRSVSSFGHQGSTAGMLRKPWGVAVNERNEIAVTETGNNRVFVFSSDGIYIRSFGSKGDKQREFSYPAGVAFDSLNGNIIVADNGNEQVKIFSEDGDYLSHIAKKGNLDHQLSRPLGLSVDNDGNIIVADRDNKVVKLFSRAGEAVYKILRLGSFSCPFHCVECNSHLIVSDSHEHCINVFDRAGNFLYKFGKKGEEDGEFNNPHCLSVDKAGHLMVCDAGNHRVQVFEQSGKFITKFGTKGSGIGEFNGPVATAVLSDGRIVVTDFYNNRVQIFE